MKREFTAEAPNQKWVTDVTEFAVADRKVYLSPVMDLFDRRSSPIPGLSLRTWP
ncbi:hypothetical protein ABZV91_17280 [Nocardia sp. NPDC004568]|uniref:hypothetical protein n=1 Tax=Nocardia sp. NPDC004568 TaxID=3154551 RepID=UPI0033ABE738